MRICQECGEAIEHVPSGRTFRLCRPCRAAHRSGHARNAQPVETLTPRQRQLGALLVEGKRNHEIASALHLTVATVKHYMHLLYDRMGIRNRVELAVYLSQHRIEVTQ